MENGYDRPTLNRWRARGRDYYRRALPRDLFRFLADTLRAAYERGWDEAREEAILAAPAAAA